MIPAPIQTTATTITGTATAMPTMTSRVDPEGARRMMDLLVNLYADRRLAVVREYTANAIDAARLAGSTIPVDITTPTVLEPNLIITDRGVGMSTAEVEATYLAFAASTKRDTNDQVGGLGVGAKSAWALAESFLVDTVKDGLRTIVRASRDLEHQVLVAGTPTDLPAGTTVSIPVEVNSYSSEWSRVITEVATAHDPGTITVNGKPVASIAAGATRIGPVIAKRVRDGYGASILIRSGGTLFESIPAITTRLRQDVKLKSFVVELPIGSFDHTPSREQVIDTPRTREAIAAAMEQYKTAYAALEAEIGLLAKTDVTAAVKRRNAILGDVGDYMVLPIDLSLEVPGGLGAWRNRRRWERLEPPAVRDTFSATSWDTTEAAYTIIVTGVPAGRALRTFATYVKNHHGSTRRIIPIPAGQQSVALVVSDNKTGPTGQMFHLDATMVPANNVYTWEDWQTKTASVRTGGGGGSRGPVTGYNCLVVAQDGGKPVSRELTAAEIAALNLPVWYVDDANNPETFSKASVGVILGRRKPERLLKSLPAAISLYAWQAKCAKSIIDSLTQLDMLALALESDSTARTRFAIVSQARDELLAAGRASSPLMEQAMVVLAWNAKLSNEQKQNWDALKRSSERNLYWNAKNRLDRIESAIKQAWPLVENAGTYRGGVNQDYVDYVVAVAPKRLAAVDIDNETAS